MLKKSLAISAAVAALLTTQVHAEGLIGKQYLDMGFKHGVFGKNSSKDLLGNTKGIIATYNRPLSQGIDIGASVEHNKADGTQQINGNNSTADFKLGGGVIYATLYTTRENGSKVFITPQIGVQKSKLSYSNNPGAANKKESDLFAAVDAGMEFTPGRWIIAPAVGVSHADETRLHGKMALGFNLTKSLVFKVDGNYQFNKDNDYALTAGVVVKF